MRHGVAHKPADTAVSVGERMNVAQSMVRRRDRQNTRGLAQPVEAVALCEISHEIRNTVARRRLVPTDRHVVLGARAPPSGLHPEFVAAGANAEHLFRRIAIKFAMQPANEVDGCGFGQAIQRIHVVDFGLDADVRGGLGLQVAPPRILDEISRQRPLDILRSCDVPLDQVAVIGVHHLGPFLGVVGDELAELGRRHQHRYAAKVGDAGGELGVHQCGVQRWH